MQRNRQAELMDDPNLDSDLHSKALRGLERLNIFSFTANHLWQQLQYFYAHNKSSKIRVLDLATGSGDIPVILAKHASRSGLPFEFVGADISPTAVHFANDRTSQANVSVSFVELDVLSEAIPKDFDVIITSLFTHHLDPIQVIDLLAKMRIATKQYVIVNDLIRSEFSLLLVWLATRLLSKSKIVHHDGPASVKAAYTMQEMENMATQAGLVNYKIHHCFPCRQLLVWRKPI